MPLKLLLQYLMNASHTRVDTHAKPYIMVSFMLKANILHIENRKVHDVALFVSLPLACCDSSSLFAIAPALNQPSSQSATIDFRILSDVYRISNQIQLTNTRDLVLCTY